MQGYVITSPLWWDSANAQCADDAKAITLLLLCMCWMPLELAYDEVAGLRDINQARKGVFRADHPINLQH